MPRVAFAVPTGEVDYTKPASWVARPDLPDDPSRWLPPGVARTQPGRIAVFFVPPTTYLDRDRWNAPLADPSAEARLKLFVSSQASAFNGVGEIWAPRYRQAVAGAFLTNEGAATQALDFAYRDVERAFDAFLAAIPPDRPILLAAHSQGSRHLMTLLARRIAGTPTAKRIVAAYLVGWPISTTVDLPRLGLPPCTAPTQTGCILSWQSFGEPADTHFVTDLYDPSIGLTGAPRRGTPMLCVNPLTGTAGATAPASANKGALVPRPGMAGADLHAGIVPATCQPSGFLSIGEDLPAFTAFVLPGHNFHVFDYALFWASIRADATTRAAAFP